MFEKTVVVYEGTPGIRLDAPGLTIVGSSGEDLVATAMAYVDQGFERVEVCGGVGSVMANEVRAAVDGRARVGLLRYSAESLEQIAAFKQAFTAGEVLGLQVFLYAADEGAEEVEHPDVTLIPIESVEHAESVGRRLADVHAGMAELYGGLNVEHAAAVLRGGNGAVPVGFVGYDN